MERRKKNYIYHMMKNLSFVYLLENIYHFSVLKKIINFILQVIIYRSQIKNISHLNGKTQTN